MEKKRFLKHVGLFVAYIVVLTAVGVWLGNWFVTHWIVIGWVVLSFLPLVVAWPVSILYSGTKPSDSNVWHKFKHEYAAFGSDLWSLEHLWFVVFLVGFYATLSMVAEEVINQGKSLDSAEIWLCALRDLLITGFLAVITSVVAHMFTGAETSSLRLEAIEGKVEGCLPKIESAGKLIQHTCDTLDMMAAIVDAATFQREIRSASQNIGLEYPETKFYLDQLVQKFKLYMQSSFEPLTLPGHLQEYVNKPENLPRCGYMSAILGRYFESEIETRSCPGAFLNITSFAFYVQTVKEVVESLKKWHKEYEFYTTMPSLPSNIFRFQNSLDIGEWIEFLKYFHSFHQDKRGKWMRYFLYFKKQKSTGAKKIRPDEINLRNIGCPSFGEMVADIKDAIVIVDQKDSWIPKILSKAEVMRYIGAISSDHDRQRTEDVNSFHEGQGTFVGYDSAANATRSKYKRWFKECLLGYHVTENSLRYMCTDEIDHYFQKEYTLRGVIPGKGGRSVESKFRMPCDIFAVRKLNPSSGGQWEFVIARECSDEYINGLGLAFSPILEFDRMTHEDPSKDNSDTAREIKAMLNDIFLSGDELTHSQTMGINQSK